MQPAVWKREWRVLYETSGSTVSIPRCWKDKRLSSNFFKRSDNLNRKFELNWYERFRNKLSKPLKTTSLATNLPRTIFAPYTRALVIDTRQAWLVMTPRKSFHKPRLCSFTRQFSTCLNSNSSNVIHWIVFHELTTRRFVQNCGARRLRVLPSAGRPATAQRENSTFSQLLQEFRGWWLHRYYIYRLYIHQQYLPLRHPASIHAAKLSEYLQLARVHTCHSFVAIDYKSVTFAAPFSHVVAHWKRQRFSNKVDT